MAPQPPGILRQFPRALVVLAAVVQGRDLSEPPNQPLVVVPRKVTHTRRPHHQADTCDVELDGIHLPFDLRTVDAVLVSVFLGNVPENHGDDWRRDETRRFVGYVDLGETEQGEDDSLTLKCRDLSAALRDAKPLPTAAAPLYSDTLRTAIVRVLDNVPGGEALSIMDTGDLDIPLAPLVNRRTQGEHIPLQRDMTAWAVIEHVAGLANRMVSVDGELLVLRQPSQAYQNHDQPAATLEFNTSTANLLTLKATKKFVRNRKGIRVVAWDASNRRRVEAIYPPDAELPQRGRPRTGRSRRAPQPPERDVFPVGNVTNEGQLLEVARGLWQERSRQELEVEVECPIFDEPFLSLKNGQRVRLQLNRALAAGLNTSQSTTAQVSFVQQRLRVPRSTAEVLVRAAQNPGADLFYLRTGTTTWDSEGDCLVTFELVNLIAVEVRRGA